MNLTQMMLSIRNICFNLEYELPLNKRFMEQFKEMIEDRGFVVVDTLPQDNVTIFGKSQPDIIIYRSEGRYIKGTSVTGAAISICEISGATLELKKNAVHLKSRSPQLAQSCANMVRVSGYLTEKALQKGFIVEEINIFGLLVSHTSCYCVPLKHSQ